MTMESPVVQSGAQGVNATSANGSPVAETPPMMHTLQPMAVTSGTHATTDSQVGGQMALSQLSMSQIPASMHPAFVMAPPSGKDQHVAAGHQSQFMMQPPGSIPFMVPSYQRILPTQGLVDQQGLQQTDSNSRATTPGSPAVGGSGSRSATPATVYQQQILQVTDAQKTECDAVPSPVRQGSVGSGGSPAPPTPGSLGSPLPQMMVEGMLPQQGIQLPLQPGQLPMNIQVGIGLTPQPAVVESVKEEEKIDISKLKPPKKPLTPYMRFSKSIWPQVKSVNTTLSVCEIGATIGRMWRELADTEKQRYNEDFANDKIRYDVEIQAFLKLTGLQASDLVKARPKKKGSANRSKNNQAQKAAQAQPAQQNTVVQQVPRQQLIGVQPVLQSNTINGPVPVSIHNSGGTTTALPQQVLSNALSGLPHFSQVWTGQQGATILSQGQGTGQEQVIVQQGPGGQQVFINAVGLPPGTVVNGSAAGGGENVLSTPILIQPTGDQTSLFSAEAEGQAEKVDGQAEGIPTSQATLAQLASMGWQQVVSNPGDLQQQQQHMINLINMAAQSGGVQPDQLAQAAQMSGIQPSGIPLGLQQVNIGATSADSNTESQPMEQGGITQVLSTEASQNGAQAQTLPNGPNTSQSVVTLAQVPTAHSLYNSYGFNPWSAFPGQVVQEVAPEGTPTEAGTPTTGGIQVIYNRENILETEAQHLRSALSEKTKEVQRLSQELEKAYNIIEQLKQQNPTAVIQLPAPQAEVPQADNGTPPATTVTTTT